MADKVESTTKLALGGALAVSAVDLFQIRDLIGRVFFDTSDFITWLMYGYLIIFSYAVLNFTTGTRVGKTLIQYLTGIAQELITINFTILVAFYLLGQGEDVLSFVFYTFLGYTGPQGLLAYALDYSLNSSTEPKQPVAQVENAIYNYVPVKNGQQQAYMMI